MKYNYYEDCYFSMGDFDTVTDQIRARSRLDPGYQHMGGLRTGYPDRFDVNENLISTLADLDALIASCKMTAGQRRVVDLLMKGHSFAEIACISGRDSDSVRDQFDRAVRCINVQNSAAWAACCKRRMDMD